jgi:hypothetical protein
LFHCPLQKLKPEYAKAATDLKQHDDKIVIGKVSRAEDASEARLLG